MNLAKIAHKMASEPDFVSKLPTDPKFLTLFHEFPAEAAAIQSLLSQEGFINSLLDVKNNFLPEGYPWFAQEKITPNI